MSDIAVSVDHVWKKFHRGELHDSLRDFIPAMAKRLLGRGPKRDQLAEGDFWALKDVAFEVKQGEVLGIIGPNGAGKSTLLKVLSRIIRPNRGSIRVNGRLRALIEIAAGFHPDLTGRENIYLNGAILGMSKREIDRKFDEIVDFSGIEAFLDTPVKRYSSGMHARLGFAVAAHLDPEILLVDEVLSVGDAEFQKRCLGKMSDVASSGRTILFVSHNMAAVVRLCHRVVLLEAGRLALEGDAYTVTRRYLHTGEANSGQRVWVDAHKAPGDQRVRLRSVCVRDDSGVAVDTIDVRQAISIEVEYDQLEPALPLTTILRFSNEEAICLFSTADFNNLEWRNTSRQRGRVTCVCHIPGNFFAEGRVSVLVAVGTYNPNRVYALQENAISFEVIDQSEGDGVRGAHVGNWPGVLRPMMDWTVNTSDFP